jgi:hypothetical protein
MSSVFENMALNFFTAETLRAQRFAESCGKLINYAMCITLIGCDTANNLLVRFAARQSERENKKTREL